jgi:WD40 repeat protein
VVVQWDAATGQERRLEVGMLHLRSVLGVAYSPDGALLASSGGDGTVRVWEARTGRQRQNTPVGPPPRSDIWGVTFSPDGRHLATANGNGTVSILRLAAPK